MSGSYIGLFGRIEKMARGDLRWGYGFPTFTEAKKDHIRHLEDKLSVYEDLTKDYRMYLHQAAEQEEETE